MRARSPRTLSTTDQGMPVHSALVQATHALLASIDIDDNATRTRLLIYVLSGFVVIIALASIGWARRRRRQRTIPRPASLPADIGTVRGEFDGFYVSTTPDGQPLNRIAVRGLGFRARATIAVADTGVVLALPGNNIFIPRGDIREVTRSNYTIDRVVEPGGLVLLAWTLGDVKLDSYLRVENTDELVHSLSGLLPTKSGKKA
jgi:hypothetical protein